MKKIIYTKNAPEPLGPYSQAVAVGNTLYLSGQIAINPETNELVLDNIEVETERVMNNIKALLDTAGFSFNDVVKSSIFISDMGDFNKINEVYAKYFDADKAPARETVEVSCLPKNVNVEISMIAIKA